MWQASVHPSVFHIEHLINIYTEDQVYIIEQTNLNQINSHVIT